MRKKQLRPRDFFDWVSVIVDVAEMIGLVAGALGLLYWFVSTRSGLSTVIVALSVAMAGVMGLLVWIAVNVTRARS